MQLAELKGLSIYWNSSSEIFHSNSASNELMLQKMKDYIDNPEIKYGKVSTIDLSLHYRVMDLLLLEDLLCNFA